MSEPRTLLVIAGEFPPLKTIGRIRTVKFVEQLRQYGWRSIVITLEPSGTEGNYDPSLMAEIAVAALAGSLLYGIVALIERWMTFWHPSQRH